VFGLNAAVPYRISADEIRTHTGSDAVARSRAGYLEHRDPHFATYGPKTRRQFFNLLRAAGGTHV